MEQGERGLGLTVIVSGSVRVVKKLATGEELEVATSGPGEFIGEIAVLDDSPRSASVIAKEETECLVLASWTFNAAMKNHPENRPRGASRRRAQIPRDERKAAGDAGAGVRGC